MEKSFKNYSQTVAIGLMLIMSTGLSGCASDVLQEEMSMEAPAPYAGSKAYPITVVKGPVTLEVATAQGSLQPAQINAVTGFAHQAMQAGVTPITVSRPSGGGNSARVANEIANLITQQGLSRKMVRVATYPADANAPVNVSYVSTYAQTKACGDWSEDVTDTYQNRHMNNHGCSVQANIAAMLANPGSLVVPTTSTPIRANTRVNAIKVLEKDPTSRSSLFSIFN
jgi:pilus assembly protein CpaD